MFDHAADIDVGIESRSISFENPTGGRGRGGMAAAGRKGAPSRIVGSAETVLLADVEGPGCVRHIWMTFPPDAPERLRALWIEVFYDDLTLPSISVPCLDFFGLAHGRAVAYSSALTAVQEARGFNAYYPMPFSRRIRIQLTNSGPRPIALFHQIDYTLGARGANAGYLHASFRRENPTTKRRDFVIADGFEGPGRFLGCVVGVRVFKDGMHWYGEGEFKAYIDGDAEYPTICGTGLEDYVGTAWGMGAHTTNYAGVPLNLRAPKEHRNAGDTGLPDFVSFYRWHLADPIVFRSAFRATLQQIGGIAIAKGKEHLMNRYEVAGTGWVTEANKPDGLQLPPGSVAWGIAERVDDYCATAFVYCSRPQPVPRLDVQSAVRDLAALSYEATPAA
jgi:hypothetical protein